MAQSAEDYAAVLQARRRERIAGSVHPAEYMQRLVDLVKNNPDLGEIRHLAEQGRMIARLVIDSATIEPVMALEAENGALAVDGGLRLGLSLFRAHEIASQQIDHLQRQAPGGEQSQLTMDQRISLAAQEIDREKIQAEMRVNLLSAAITFAGASIKSLLALNGGAALALLAFIGHLATSPDAGVVPNFKVLLAPLIWLSGGAFCGGALAALAYLAQISFSIAYDSGKAANYAANFFRVGAILTALFGFGCFVKGVLSAAKALELI